MLFLAQPVRFTRTRNEFTFHAIVLESAISLLALPKRVRGIRIALQNEDGRLRIFHVKL